MLIVFSSQGQSFMNIYEDTLMTQGDYISAKHYSEAAFCGPGEAIQEEITFYSNMTFLYLSLKETPNIIIVASGKYSLKNKHLFLDYDWIKLDSSTKKADSFNVNKIKLYTEFRIVKDRHWTDADIPRLLECGSHMSKFRCFLVYGKNWNHHRNIFLVKRKRLKLKQFTTYGLFKEQANKIRM